jgi:DNA-binding IclR family transcriptional regulator
MALPLTSVELPRISVQTLAILLALRRVGESYGAQIAELTGIPASGVYRTLNHLAKRGWLTKRAEQDNPPQRPPRLYYELTVGAQFTAIATLHQLDDLAEEQT